MAAILNLSWKVKQRASLLQTQSFWFLWVFDFVRNYQYFGKLWIIFSVRNVKRKTPPKKNKKIQINESRNRDSSTCFNSFPFKNLARKLLFSFFLQKSSFQTVNLYIHCDPKIQKEPPQNVLNQIDCINHIKTIIIFVSAEPLPEALKRPSHLDIMPTSNFNFRKTSVSEIINRNFCVAVLVWMLCNEIHSSSI